LKSEEVEDAVIRVKNVSKKFARSLKRSMLYGATDIGRNIIGISSQSDKLRKDEFWAVNNISFELNRGESLGIIGANGSGKTTLLSLLNGIYMPDKGRITVRGKVGALIAVGAGFHPMLTGRENIFLNAAILGLDREEMKEKFPDIVEFADIGNFLDTPVKNYSSGMFVRLGFAVSVHCEPDILLVDEILSVGDAHFRTKSARKMHELLDKNATLVFVSHNMHIVRAVCDRVIVMDKGECQYIGPVDEGIKIYEKSMLKHLPVKLTEEKMAGGSVNFVDIKLLRDDNKVIKDMETDEHIIVQMIIESKSRLVDPIINVRLYNTNGNTCWNETTSDHNFNIGVIEGRVELRCRIEKIQVVTGNYYFTMNLRDGKTFNGLTSGYSDLFYVQSPVPLRDEMKDVFHPLIEWGIQPSKNNEEK